MTFNPPNKKKETNTPQPQALPSKLHPYPYSSLQPTSSNQLHHAALLSISFSLIYFSEKVAL
jgi:hypothetical protein